MSKIDAHKAELAHRLGLTDRSLIIGRTDAAKILGYSVNGGMRETDDKPAFWTRAESGSVALYRRDWCEDFATARKAGRSWAGLYGRQPWPEPRDTLSPEQMIDMAAAFGAEERERRVKLFYEGAEEKITVADFISSRPVSKADLEAWTYADPGEVLKAYVRRRFQLDDRFFVKLIRVELLVLAEAEDRWLEGRDLPKRAA